MITNIIENRKQKEFIVKIVLGSADEAMELCNEISDCFDMNEKNIDKMKIGMGLDNLRIDDVFNNVIIHYNFKSAAEAKHFSFVFSDLLADDYSNLMESLLVFEKREIKNKSTYEVSLKLPKDIEKTFALDIIDSVCTVKYPSIKINRELLSFNGKKVILLIEDFTSELIAIKLTKSGNTYHLPQQWLDIQENSTKGVYDTRWVMDLKNFVRVEGSSIVSKHKNGNEVRVEQELIKLDGQSSKFLEDKDGFIDTVSNLTVPKEIVVLSVS